MSATVYTDSFVELQEQLLDHYGVHARSRYVTLGEPADGRAC